jgi:hypothetical protein
VSSALKKVAEKLFKARRSKKFRAVGEEESEFKTSVDMMGF